MLCFMVMWLCVCSSSCLCACSERVWDVCSSPIGEERVSVREGHMYSRAAPVLQMQKNSAEIDREPCVRSPSANTAPHCTRQHACFFFSWTNNAHWKTQINSVLRIFIQSYWCLDSPPLDLRPYQKYIIVALASLIVLWRPANSIYSLLLPFCLLKFFYCCNQLHISPLN